ncbi:hypothetical protein B566_EDAN008079 [Ephemera danica]|nr:hypothetical protein B566_EDAN008079 [Ephemera danica]
MSLTTRRAMITPFQLDSMLPMPHSTSTRRPSAVFDINDVITHDRWVVIQPWAGVPEPPVSLEDELRHEPRDVREVLTCAVVEACVEQGWRPLVLAERVACCSKPRCVLLHAAKRARLPYELRHYFERNNVTNMAAQRNLAFLFAIQHGARFVMDWYLEDLVPSEPRAVAEYQKRATQLLLSTTLDVSLGLVLERAADAPLFAVSPRPVRRVYNPHAHFGRPDYWATGFRPPEQRHVSLGLMMSSPRARLVPRWATESPPRRRAASPSASGSSPRQRYRVCELRPPSIEKFLQQPSGGIDELDLAAPAVVIPGDTLAPASSQISLYSGEALWALALLPAAEHPVPAHLLRTLWAYPLLANIAASVKVSLSPLPAPTQYTG